MSIYYRPQAQEQRVFALAAQQQLPVLLKGPTGCGKTRFVRAMAEALGRELITVACQEDLAASDLTGRYVLEGGATVWRDGPLTSAVRRGAICYLDEVVEARPDVLTVLHPLTDDRRILPLDRLGEQLHAPPDFMVVVSYNPGYQSVVRELKASTRQRFVSLRFDYPSPEVEAEIVAHEASCSEETARQLVRLGVATRRLRAQGLAEGASTRLLVQAARLIQGGLEPREAVEVSVVEALTDDPELTTALRELARAQLG